MYYLVWEYEVESSAQEKFENTYGRAGDWFKLFEPCGDFLGSELVKNSAGASYLLIDKWIDKSSYDSFISSVKADYDVLHESSKELYSSEKLIGTYETL